MNKVSITGRLTRDVEARVSAGANPTTVARYTLAVDRRFKDTEQTADFINVVAFGKAGEFADKYFRKGMKVGVNGRIQTGSYTNKDGVKVYTFDVIAEEQEFEKSKKNSEETAPARSDGFIPDDGEEWSDVEDLPFGEVTR